MNKETDNNNNPSQTCQDANQHVKGGFGDAKNEFELGESVASN
jgi:hypothetical protein